MSYGYSTIDTRDLIEEKDDLLERLAPVELGEFAQIVRDGVAHAHPWLNEDVLYPRVGPALDLEEQNRIVAIDDLLEEVGDEAEYGVTLVPDEDFVSFAEDLADDIGAVDSDAAWPNNFIDWERAADALRQDYSTVEFDGVDYLFRA